MYNREISFASTRWYNLQVLKNIYSLCSYYGYIVLSEVFGFLFLKTEK